MSGLPKKSMVSGLTLSTNITDKASDCIMYTTTTTAVLAVVVVVTEVHSQ